MTYLVKFEDATGARFYNGCSSFGAPNFTTDRTAALRMTGPDSAMTMIWLADENPAATVTVEAA